MSKVKFWSIKRKEGVYEGMFIVPTEEEARELAKKNNFKVDENTVFEDVSKEMTEVDKLHKDTVVSGESD